MSCRNAIILLLIFLIFSFVVLTIPEVTQYDISCIRCIQGNLVDINKQIPIIAGGWLFYLMTLLPLLICCTYFFVNKMYKQMFYFGVLPFIAYFINSIIKIVVQRPRPPLELQFEEHMTSSSYVSRHTFVTACLWGMFIYIVCRYCKNKFLKYLLIGLSTFWIFFEGFSRIWMGVHNPTDVIGALILSCVFLIFYIRIFEQIDSKSNAKE